MRAANDRRSSKTSLLFLAVGCAAAGGYFALPVGSTPMALLDAAFPLATVVAIIAGIKIHRPARPRPWALFAIGMTCFALNNCAEITYKLFYDAELPAAYPDDLIQILGYVLIISALISLIYSRKGGDSDRSSLIDATIVVVGASMLSWVFLIAPFAHDQTLPLSERLFRMSYPLADLILLGVSVRLAVSRGARTLAFSLLLLAMLASLFSNTAVLEVLNQHGIVAPDSPVNLGFLLAYVFAGAAPLHPSMKTLTDIGEHETYFTKTRIGAFLAASLAGPGAYAIEAARGRDVDVAVILAGSLAIFILVLARMAGLAKTLRHREERFRSLIQNASDVFAILDEKSVATYVSPANERILGYKADELIGTVSFSHVHPDDIEKATAFFEEVLSSPGELKQLLLRVGHKDGSWRWLETSATNLLLDPSVGGIIANYHDVTEKKVAEDALRVSEASSRLLFESSPLPMWVYEAETLDFLAVNDAAVEHYGYSRPEFLSMTIADIRPPEDLARLMENVKEDRDLLQTSGPWRHCKKDGEVIDVEIASHVIDFAHHKAVLVVSLDVTERNRIAAEKENLEKQLRQSQKLEAVGQLAGGVAHDFNNLLAVILNYARFLREDLEGSEGAEDADQILHATNKAANLVRQLLAFSRREIIKPEVLDLNSVVTEMERMLRRTTKESISIVVQKEPELWRTEVDPGQLEQVILNLVVNADGAMPDGGTLQIRTGNRTIDEVVAGQRAGLEAGNYVWLSVSDDGLGMSKEVVAHIFEPFFTTKAVGEGTGLGLSTAYGIVKQAGGDISVYSEPGKGTTFNIYLPATSAEVTPRKTTVPGDRTYIGTETILVVEDEKGVREIAQRLLTKAGYTVLASESPLEALTMVDGDGPRIDLLLTDVIMPELSGRQLASRLAAKIPGLPTIYMSGYTDEIIARQGILEGGVSFLQKPFGEEDLLPLVREVIDRRPSLPEVAPPVSNSNGRRSVVIVDDEAPMREVLRMLLESHHFRVLGEASDGEQAVAMARELHPDLVLLDHMMPGMDGKSAAPLLRAASPESLIVVFSAVLSSSPDWADGFLSKERIGELPPLLESLSS